MRKSARLFLEIVGDRGGDLERVIEISTPGQRPRVAFRRVLQVRGSGERDRRLRSAVELGGETGLHKRQRKIARLER